MNDFLEVEHGFECLNAAYKSPAGKALSAAMDFHYPGLSQEAVTAFNSWLPGIRGETYITCFSEHMDHEDEHGRLSMWRAYGGDSGVALVIKPDVMFMQNQAVGLIASPVVYWNQEDVETELHKVADRINSSPDFVRSLGREQAKAVAFSMFRFAVLCTKHPGFAEEREWRVISSPLMDTSPLLTPSLEVVKGVPQQIQKIGFSNHPELNIHGLELGELLDRVIVGPTEYPFAIHGALRTLVDSVAASEPAISVAVSRIPLRQPTT